MWLPGDRKQKYLNKTLAFLFSFLAYVSKLSFESTAGHFSSLPSHLRISRPQVQTESYLHNIKSR